jgi:hypothetical protein
MNCPVCGRPATHRLAVPVASSRGTAIRYERRCIEHAVRLATELVLDGSFDGFDSVIAEPIDPRGDLR